MQKHYTTQDSRERECVWNQQIRSYDIFSFIKRSPLQSSIKIWKRRLSLRDCQHIYIGKDYQQDQVLECEILILCWEATIDQNYSIKYPSLLSCYCQTCFG
ncbi:hypothetical protein CMV_025759 [Castanea mollissima]|uniref:Uncharacterized protein n=1 Tax=Castanea mollissima TaxID=60419 RepID=A0A8J4VGK4_9ROSI|nr:hypothetical protein CMV_025759 [Castanea mollissima]